MRGTHSPGEHGAVARPAPLTPWAGPVEGSPEAGEGSGAWAVAVSSRGEQEVPRMRDQRLVLPALAAWVGTWAGTALASRTGCVDEGAPLETCAADVDLTLAVPLGLLAVLSLLAAVALVVLQRRSGPEAEPRHSLVPAGSIRLGAALALLALAVGLAAGTLAALHHLRDPGLRAGVIGEEYAGLVVLEEDRSPSSGTRWLWARTLGPRGAWPLVAGEVRVLLHWTPPHPVARGTVVEVRGRLDRSFASAPPSIGAMRHPRVEVREGPHGMEAVGAHLRAALRSRVAGLSPQVRALVPGMAAGDDSAASPELTEAMRAASLAHLTAVSGTHVAVLVSGVTLLLPARGWWRAVGVLAALVGTVVLAGPAPSVLRACVMAGVAVGGTLLGRRGDALAGLSTAILALVLLDPWAARSTGFALSVAATWAMLVPAPALGRRLDAARGARAREQGEDDARPSGAARCVRRPLRAGVDLVLVSVCIQLATAPVLMLIDPLVPTWSVPANALVSVVVAPTCLLCTLAAWSAWALPGVADSAVACVSPLLDWIAGVAGVVSHWPWARLPGVALLGAAACCAVGAGLVAAWRHGWGRGWGPGLRDGGGTCQT